MVSFMVPAAGGTAAVLAGVLVAGSGSGFSSDQALTAVSCVGNILACFLMVAPLYTFLRPMIIQNSVGDRTVHGHVLTMLSGAAWGLYAVITWKDSRTSTVINAACFGFQLLYVCAFIWFAAGKTRWIAAGLLVAALAKTGGLAWMVVVKVIRRGEMQRSTIAAIASVISCVTYIAVAYDVWAVAKSKDVSNMDPLAEVLFSLLNAVAAVYFAYMSSQVDNYIGVPNVIGVVLLLVELVLYAMHCGAKPEEEPPVAEAEAEPKEEPKAEEETSSSQTQTQTQTYNASSNSSPDFGHDLVALFDEANHRALPQSEIEFVIDVPTTPQPHAQADDDHRALSQSSEIEVIDHRATSLV